MKAKRLHDGSVSYRDVRDVRYKTRIIFGVVIWFHSGSVEEPEPPEPCHFDLMRAVTGTVSLLYDPVPVTKMERRGTPSLNKIALVKTNSKDTTETK